MTAWQGWRHGASALAQCVATVHHPPNPGAIHALPDHRPCQRPIPGAGADRGAEGLWIQSAGTGRWRAAGRAQPVRAGGRAGAGA